MSKKTINCGTLNSNQQLGKDYWNERWEKAETGWDIGYSSPPIEKFMLQYENKNNKILIPGCGNAHEVEFLLAQGFKNITVLDISNYATEILKNRFMNFPEINVVCEDFFQHTKKYDLIIEQTFFCAIPTILRNDYAKKSAELLNDGGMIMGLLFNKVFDKKGPPFGGTEAEYRFTFKKYFEILKMENCYNSIEPRKGNELFINLKKK